MQRIKKCVCMVFFILLACMVSGCGKKTEIIGIDTAGDVPTYVRETLTISLDESANPYMVRFFSKGFAFFSMDETGDYQFFFRAYGEEKVVPICKLSVSYVKDFSLGEKENKDVITILTGGEKSQIWEFDLSGKSIRTLEIEDSFGAPEVFPTLLSLMDGSFLLEEGGRITHLDERGNAKETIENLGTVKGMLEIRGQGIYVWVESSEKKTGGPKCMLLDLEHSEAAPVGDLPENITGLFALDGSLAVVTEDYVYAPEESENRRIVDLNKQSLVGAQIEYLTGDLQEMKVIMLDTTAPSEEISVVTLMEREAEDEPEERKIIHVSIPEDCVYQVEFHAKRYNKSSDTCFVEVERFSGSLEDYLGKGNRPDIVMFGDNTEMTAYVEKGLLVDIVPLYEQQDIYSLDDMLPEVRRILGVNDENCLYGMAGRFRLLLRSSDGSEYDTKEQISIMEYLDWYDSYLTENGIAGIGDLDTLMYAVIGEFYDEESATASFTQGEFKEVLQKYKEVYDNHRGELNVSTIRENNGLFATYLAKGPRWEYYYGGIALTVPGGSLQGIPRSNGKETIYMILNLPMSILSTSDCPEEAFDFLMYYNTQSSWLLKGEPEGDFEKAGNTYGYFSVFEQYLNLEIYESDKPLVAERGVFAYFTEEQKSHLRDILSEAIPDTTTQRSIYNMFLEEISSYTSGDKSLDVVCDILQNRASLYLEEHR